MFDILWQQKREQESVLVIYNCATIGFHALAALDMRRAGAAESVTASMFETTQKPKHKVTTVCGDPDEIFGVELWQDLDALMGVGQGNGVRPVIWAVIGSVFYDILRKQGCGAIITALFCKNKVDLARFGCVDNTDLLQTVLSTDDYWDVAYK